MKQIELLKNKRKELLTLPQEKIIDRILSDQYPTALVHSFAEEDFYLLIHDIGVEDSVELLSLASNRQWEYILDMEIWKKDKIQIPSVTRWLQLLLQADPNRLIKWLIKDQTNFFEYYLFHNIQVYVREHDQDPSELGDNLFTLDDVIYIGFDQRIPLRDDHNTDEEREEFLMELLNRLADYDFKTYQHILFESAAIIPSEAEEETYRLRNVRLAEKGFVPFDEAVGIYQPIKPEHIQKVGRKYLKPSKDSDYYLPVPMVAINLLDGENLFTQALKQVQDVEAIELLQSEFAGLSNHIISADQKPIRGKESLKAVVDKASGYLSIGLELLLQHINQPSIQTAVDYILTYPLSSIFKVGYSAALDLKWQAEKWRKQSWFSNHNLPISFWGEEWMGVLGGILIPKPMFFDNYKTGQWYRDFQSLSDIRITHEQFQEIVAFDEMLRQMNLSTGKLSKQSLTYKNLLLTHWARHYLGLSNDSLRISIQEFKPFFLDLLPQHGTSRTIPDAMKSSFLNWVSKISGIHPSEISEKMARYFENLFMEIEKELGNVSPEKLDPKHVYMFLLKSEP